MTVITRFAPSPTGFLHIGGVRTALFNYLFARSNNGKYVLRIEDTDRERSTEEAVGAIINGLDWLELSGDQQPIFQYSRQERHKQIVNTLLEEGKAYKCYCSAHELEEMRALARREGKTVLYDRRWREKDPITAPPNVNPVVRLKSPLKGSTTIDDLVQGRVEVKNEQLDDFVILRADGTPTYMLSVVVDDHDMEISHVIRGDDHLNNAFRQYQIYAAMDWPTPKFAHIPLILGQDGTKLSKRHGALGIEAYKDQGYLPEALCNYLLRLGWGHENEEIITREQAIALFEIDAVGKSPSRFDIKKLDNIKDYLPLLSQDKTQEENKNFRPSGWYETLLLQKSYQVKKIVLYKNQSISLQLHHHRSEHWVVTKGIALVTNNDKEYELNEGESTFIPKKTKHRLKNIGKDELEIIEVQIGDYLGEDDIVRFDDKYGRT